MSTQDTIFKEKFTLRYKGKKLDLSVPRIMGIINLTPDSFFDGGSNHNMEYLLKKAGDMVDAGASILDLGAVSTRPGSKDPGTEEELRRLLPPLRLLRATFPQIFISVDTYRAEVALAAAESGADIINDVYAGSFDDDMFATIASLKIPYIIMHMQGHPENMQANPVYEKGVVKEVSLFFRQKLKTLAEKKINQVIIDPGFGFGKTTEHNYELLKQLNVLKKFGFPVLAGVSRKSMINRVLGTKPQTALNGTTVANTLALINGANILRVHDVKEAVETVKIIAFYKSV